jgi:putative ABC transport system permease protein
MNESVKGEGEAGGGRVAWTEEPKRGASARRRGKGTHQGGPETRERRTLSAGPVARAAAGGLGRRRVQSVVIGLVLLASTAASVLALGLIVDSRAPFDHAFGAQRGADVMATVSTRVPSAELAATARLPEVSAAGGPFGEVVIQSEQGGQPNPPMILAGRSSPGGPVDDLTLQSGHWADGPGQIVVASNPSPGEGIFMSPGNQIVVTGLRGQSTLTVVGMADSVTSTATGWVSPAEIARLRALGAPAATQMLYRFRSAGSAAAIGSDMAAVSAKLPPGAVTGSTSWLQIQTEESGSIAPFVPFLVAFGVIGLVLSVLIVANVVSGAVVSGYQRIGVLKSIGFTPGQVVAAYAGQVAVPAVVGCLVGTVLGNVMAAPLLSKAARVYGVGSLPVPVWVDVAVPVTMLGLAAVAAVLPSLRAGRLSAVQAIAAGRAPRQGRGYLAHRLLGRLRLPRPVTIGLAAPFARPARTAMTLVAILLGATAVTFAVGLSTSLNRVINGLNQDGAQQLQLFPTSQNVFTISAAGQRTIETALRDQPGTLHYVAETDDTVTVAGLSQQVELTAFRGDSSWTGYPVITGHWFTGPGQVVVPTGFLNATGKAVGDTVTMTIGGRQVPVRIVGEIFSTQDRGVSMITDWQTVAGASPSLALPDQYDVGLRPGTSASAYAQGLGSKLGSAYAVSLNSRNSPVVDLMLGLIGALTLMLAAVAGLGVLNTVVLTTRERVHDLGVFKAVGMTPRQAIGMVMCWVAGVGLVAGVIAVPAGIVVHNYVLPVMASSANVGLPASYLHVYAGWEMVALALAGVVIAAAGALLPAGWAAGIRTATALRTE